VHSIESTGGLAGSKASRIINETSEADAAALLMVEMQRMVW